MDPKPITDNEEEKTAFMAITSVLKEYDVNKYATVKSIGKGVLLLALLLMTSKQLKDTITLHFESSFYDFVVLLSIVSIALQVTLAFLLAVMGSRDLNKDLLRDMYERRGRQYIEPGSKTCELFCCTCLKKGEQYAQPRATDELEGGRFGRWREVLCCTCIRRPTNIKRLNNTIALIIIIIAVINVFLVSFSHYGEREEPSPPPPNYFNGTDQAL